MISVKFDTRQIERALDALGRNSDNAASRSLNRGIVAGRTQLMRDTAEDMRLRQGTVRDRLKTTNSTPSTLTATVTAGTSRLALILFGARGPEPSRGKGRGVFARTPKGRYPNAFIARLRGRPGVFQRQRSTRLPIAELFGPSVAHVAAKHTDAAAARAGEMTTKRLEHELQQEIRKAAKG